MPGVPQPMLATSAELPVGSGWAYEFKWDGVRALGTLSDGRFRLYARSGAEITAAYPEIAPLGAALAAAGITQAVLDGEIVLLDANGRPSFVALAERMHVREAGRARQLAASMPVTYMIFDVLSANGTDITGVPYVERRSWLESLAEKLDPDSASAPREGTADPIQGGASDRWVIPPRFTDGVAMLTASRELAIEGVVAKRLSSIYRPGVRSPDWVKVKHEQTGDYVIGGWRSGRRALGALLVGEPVPGGLVYRGRVGGGISAANERDLLTRLAGLRVTRSPFVEPIPREDARTATYTRPEVVVEVRYGNITPDGRLRFPRFVRLRPDKSPEEI